MDDVIVVLDDDSENSIVEVEVPKKPTPPLIEIEDEEIILNITNEKEELVLAKDFIEKDEGFSAMTQTAESSHNISSPNHWTSDMIKFYNDDWGDEDQFVVEKLQEKMDKSPSLWKVSRMDLLQGQTNVRKNYTRCWNCGQKGHNFSVCPENKNVIKCHMCGNAGHKHYSCPDSKCLNVSVAVEYKCGSYSREFITSCFKCKHEDNQTCPRCHMIGHAFFSCPDHWRMFHLTTGTTSVQIPENVNQRSSKNMWCCNCGKKGHLLVQCWHKKDLIAFKDTLPFVVSYQKAFDFKQCESSSYESPRKKNNRNLSNRNESYKSLRINPMHKGIFKNTVEFKKKLKKFKKKKKSRRKRKEQKDNFFQIVA